MVERCPSMLGEQQLGQSRHAPVAVLPASWGPHPLPGKRCTHTHLHHQAGLVAAAVRQARHQGGAEGEQAQVGLCGAGGGEAAAAAQALEQAAQKVHFEGKLGLDEGRIDGRQARQRLRGGALRPAACGGGLAGGLQPGGRSTGDGPKRGCLPRMLITNALE